jgi:hypothetical protein
VSINNSINLQTIPELNSSEVSSSKINSSGIHSISAWDDLVFNITIDNDTLTKNQIKDKIQIYKKNIYDFEDSIWKFKLKLLDGTKEINEKILRVGEGIEKINIKQTAGGNFKK